ncbi:MAG: TonB C-terminal domain-containing protein [Lentisphaeria bacterium]|nr:TonB C-terminal domain-containing protein [Lentisphaeria bacterium]
MNPGGTRKQFTLFCVILGVHCALILGPLGWNYLRGRQTAKKEIAFRVKLGGFEPSHAPEVGPPERKRPAPPAPPTPATPKPKPPTPKPVKPQKPAKPQKPTKPQKPVKPQKPAKPQKPVKPPVKPKPAEVYHDSSWDKFDPNRTPPPTTRGGSNFNRNVPIGSRDRGQKIGKADHRTPAGGAAADEEKYWASLIPYLQERWDRPPGVLVDEQTAVTIALSVDSSGAVKSKRIVKRSPNPAVNASAEALLANLTRIPAPPGGAVEFELKLVSE